MGAKVAFDEYKRNKVITASGVELIIQLYDEIMNNIRLVKPILEKGDKLSYDDVKTKSKALNKAVNVITALADSLDMEKGGDISNNLSKLYEFINMRLLNANLNNDPVMLDEAVRVLNELREAWVGIVKQEDQDKQKRTVEHQKKFVNESPVIPNSKEKAMGVYNQIGIKT
ncbi:MAG: flagellar export chaperone FliS [Thermodesulfobacteriota bacterium]|nr:flagellar export chaperone FliS [Thermodesulfobacteriota bacterium]